MTSAVKFLKTWLSGTWLYLAYTITEHGMYNNWKLYINIFIFILVSTLITINKIKINKYWYINEWSLMWFSSEKAYTVQLETYLHYRLYGYWNSKAANLLAQT